MENSQGFFTIGKMYLSENRWFKHEKKKNENGKCSDKIEFPKFIE